METAAGLAVAAVLAAAVVVTVSRVRVTVLEYERGLRYDRGRFSRTLGPGRYWYLAWRTRIETLDVRPRIVTIGAQEVLTADLVGLKVSLAVRYEVADPARAVNEVADFEEHLYVHVQLLLRGLVAQTSVETLLEQRETMGERLLAGGQAAAESLGLRLLSADVKDVMFPGDLKRTFAQVAAARQEGQAALERARGETAALRHLANAAETVERHPALLQLRLLQQLDASSGHTLVLSLADGRGSGDAVVGT